MTPPLLQIHHDGERFHATLDGHGLVLDYTRRGDQLVFQHTGTDLALRGRGLAAQLVEHALHWAAPLGLQLLPACSFVAAHIARHTRWQRLLAPAAAQQVLNFWFGPLGSEFDAQLRPLWFQKDAAVDAEIATRFGPLIEQALAGGLQDWQASPFGQLAFIVLLDQFTRNSFRGQPKSFAGDLLALPTALKLLASTAPLTSLQRWFVLMPLEHAEDLALQQRTVREFETLAATDARLAGALDYARRHLDVIARFGRFPHRNAILGRVSSQDEMAFLALPGSGF